MEKLALVLIAAHSIADFFLQSDELVKRKQKTGYLILHAAIHAAVAYAALQIWTCWQAPIFIVVVHAAIDGIKGSLKKDTAKIFVVDQMAHIASLIALAWLMVHVFALPAYAGIGYKPLVVFAGFVATVQGAGILVGKFTINLIRGDKFDEDGLPDGGKLIGQLERALIFLFIFIGQPAGIGFLVAAKSILRFEEAKKRKMAEYVLIGTLLSFSLGIALASTTKWAMNSRGIGCEEANHGPKREYIGEASGIRESQDLRMMSHLEGCYHGRHLKHPCSGK